MNYFYELLKSRRSIRKYQSKIVSPEIISKITEAALMSPASKRSNPWEFIVVQDKIMLQNLAMAREQGSHFLAEAPLAIVVAADTTKSDVWFEDASIAAIILQLQAHDLGLGSCWIQIYSRNKSENESSESFVKDQLSIPAKFAVLCIISIGYANEERNPYDTNKLATNKIRFGSF